MKKISIIVPVYNVEDYVERCILSIVSQDVSPSAYELIVVNDGSTDKSRDILQKLSETYPVMQIVDKENGGPSSARNAGLEHVKGEYIFFIDSDDWITPDSIPFLLNWIDKYPIDILGFNVCEIDDSGNTNYLTSNLSPDGLVLNIDDYLINYTVRSSQCMNLFSRSLFLKSGFKFKDGFFSEDDDFVVRIFSYAKQIIYTHKVIYYYYQRKGSTTKNKEMGLRLVNDRLSLLHELDIYVNTFSGKLKDGLQRKLDFLAVDVIRLLIRKNHSSGTIDKTLSQLNQIGYYPLRKANYSFKYKLFRLVFSFSWVIKCARLVKQYI